MGSCCSTLVDDCISCSSKAVGGCCSCFCCFSEEPPTEAPSKPVDEPPAEAPSRPVDEPSAGTPSKGETRQRIQQQQERPKEKIPSPSKLQRAREAAILVLDFTSIIADASGILKPIKVVSDCIKKILEVTKVGLNSPDEIETSLFTNSHSACRR